MAPAAVNPGALVTARLMRTLSCTWAAGGI